jgi:hypothetical protein
LEVLAVTQNDFSDLDYRPKRKTRYLLPALIVITVLAIMVFILVYPGGGDEAGLDYIENGGEKQEEKEQAEEAEPVIPEVPEERAEEEGEEDEVDEANDITPPDYDQLEGAMHKWLISRVSDPDAVMVHTGELEDIDSFLQEYSLADDNIFVYMIDSLDDSFVTVLFGPPYSEWSIKVVFMWRDDKWVFVREELLI